MPPLDPISRPPSRQARPGQPRHDLRGLAVVAAVAAALCGVVVLFQGSSSSGRTLAQAPNPAVAAGPAPTAAAPASGAGAATTDGPTATLSAAAAAAAEQPAVDPAANDAVADPDGGGAAKNTVGCEMTERSVGYGDNNSTVRCIQEALIQQKLLTAPGSGTYDNDTVAAVKKLQIDHALFVDGMAGRETGLQLGIWPDEQSLVVHTSAPAPGAKDSMGFLLSPVATSGADAPPLPENSGTGRRLVYSRAGQRIWAIGKDGTVIRSFLISGSKFGNETTGVHKVYSRSETTSAWNGRATLPLMVRWLPTKLGAIGFHAIPSHVEDGTPYQTDAELGTRLSGGCQRQNLLDAQFIWSFAQIGTPVVVI